MAGGQVCPHPLRPQLIASFGFLTVFGTQSASSPPPSRKSTQRTARKRHDLLTSFDDASSYLVLQDRCAAALFLRFT
jgi:hypothetical protein